MVGGDELADAISEERIFLDLDGRTGDEVLADLARRLAATDRRLPESELRTRLTQREHLGATALGGGVAAPHCRLPGLERPLVALGIHRSGISFGAADGQPVRLFFMIVTPERAPSAHLRLLAGVALRLREPDLPERVLAASSGEAVAREIRLEPTGAPR